MIKLVCEVGGCGEEAMIDRSVFSADSIVKLPPGWARVRLDGLMRVDRVVCPLHADDIAAAIHGQSPEDWGGS